jgi:hypothetical protein
VTTDESKFDVLIQDDSWREMTQSIQSQCAEIKEFKTMNLKGWGKQ